MEENRRNFRVNLDLRSFFEDHRRAAIIYVKKKIKTILDLQNRITEIFQIRGFYLCANERFLPPTEDVKVLEPDETVWVVPEKEQNEEKRVDSPKEFASSRVKRKKKSKEKEDLGAGAICFNGKNSLSSEQYLEEGHEKQIEPSRKRKKSKYSSEKTVEDNVERKEERKENSKINSLLPVLQSHINSCNDTGRSKAYDSVRLSHRIEGSMRPTHSMPLPLLTDKYLENKKVNIVKIDIIKKGEVNVCVDQTEVPESPTREVNSNTPSNYVKAVVRCIEEMNPPESDNMEKVESVAPVDSSAYIKTEDLTVTPLSSLETSVVSDRARTSPLSSQDSSLASSGNFFRNHRKLSGLGALLNNLRESDSVVSADSDSGGQFVTKRQRKRVRKHRKKAKPVENHPMEVEPLELKPLKTQACPLMHIKFTEEVEAPVEETGKETVVVVSDTEPELVFTGGEMMFNDDNILKSPFMTNMKPKLGDVVAFKILRIAENYTPQISNYIVGKIEALNEDERTTFKILRGVDQCVLPTGKLALTSDNDSEPKSSDVQEFEWCQLIEPRLIFP